MYGPEISTYCEHIQNNNLEQLVSLINDTNVDVILDLSTIFDQLEIIKHIIDSYTFDRLRYLTNLIFSNFSLERLSTLFEMANNKSSIDYVSLLSNSYQTIIYCGKLDKFQFILDMLQEENQVSQVDFWDEIYTKCCNKREPFFFEELRSRVPIDLEKLVRKNITYRDQLNFVSEHFILFLKGNNEELYHRIILMIYDHFLDKFQSTIDYSYHLTMTYTHPIKNVMNDIYDVYHLDERLPDK